MEVANRPTSFISNSDSCSPPMHMPPHTLPVPWRIPLFLLLGALGIANMWWAVFADVGVMVLAVLNATRMLQVKE